MSTDSTALLPPFLFYPLPRPLVCWPPLPLSLTQDVRSSLKWCTQLLLLMSCLVTTSNPVGRLALSQLTSVFCTAYLAVVQLNSDPVGFLVPPSRYPASGECILVFAIICAHSHNNPHMSKIYYFRSQTEGGAVRHILITRTLPNRVDLIGPCQLQGDNMTHWWFTG